MAKDSSTHVLVCTRSPRGRFRRAHLEFTSDWRSLELGAENDIDPKPNAANVSFEYAITDAAKARHAENVIGPDTLKRLQGEAMLAVKPADAAEIEAHRKAQAEHPGDKDAQLRAALAKNADLEARLMKLELMMQGKPAGDGKDPGKK